MKKIITTVGTSVFANYFDEEKNKDIDTTKKGHYKKLKEKPFSEWEKYKKRINALKPIILNWIGWNSSAEIKSLIKISKMLNEKLEVYLLTSDTILSNFAAEIIKEYFKGNKQISIRQIIPVKKLQVFNAEEFSREGLVNLISAIERVANDYYDDIIFNITGGYKAVIPYMTIMAQINQCDIYYIFEDTDALIKIPKTPIRVDYDEIEENYELLKDLEEVVENYPEWRNKHYSRIEKISGFIETDRENSAILSPLGRIFLSKYEQKYFIFYAPDEVWEDIQNKPEIIRILKTKFFNPQQRKNKSELKNNGSHLVFDDGNNPNRIFYFEENGKIYIYKVFTDHGEYKRYLERNVSLNAEAVKAKSEMRRIKKEVKNV